MKKVLLLLITSIITFTSCQRDDFCVDPITPNLFIGFYDAEFPDKLKTTDSLFVWAEGLDTIYNNVALDSILIPLNPSDDFTRYHFMSGKQDDILTFRYTRKEVFVSRSCGYKYIFEGLEVTPSDTNSWILNTEITNTTVEDETEHFKILH